MLIVSYPANGLGNCLRSILSTKILADSIGADFAIDFRHNRCSADIATTIQLLFPDCILPEQASPGVHPRDERNCMSFVRLYGTNSDPVVEAIFDPEDTFPREGFGLLHIYSAKPNRMSVNDYISTKHKNYVRMPFPEPLRGSVDQFCRQYDMTNLFGMHIRYTDNLLDPMKKDLNTPFSVLEQRLQSMVAAGHAILLCTDNPKIREYLQTKYAKSVVLPDAVNPALQPLYEMMLLAQTAKVSGTYSSTFSYEACLFNGTDLELFEEGRWKTYRFSLVKSACSDMPHMQASHFDPLSGENDLAVTEIGAEITAGAFAARASTAAAAGGETRGVRDPKNPAPWRRVGRNEACPCGSGKRYKRCHGVLV